MKRKVVNCKITDQETGALILVAKTNKQCDRWFKRNDPGYEQFTHTPEWIVPQCESSDPKEKS